MATMGLKENAQQIKITASEVRKVPMLTTLSPPALNTFNRSVESTERKPSLPTISAPKPIESVSRPLQTPPSMSLPQTPLNLRESKPVVSNSSPSIRQPLSLPTTPVSPRQVTTPQLNSVVNTRSENNLTHKDVNLQSNSVVAPQSSLPTVRNESPSYNTTLNPRLPLAPSAPSPVSVRESLQPYNSTNNFSIRDNNFQRKEKEFKDKDFSTFDKPISVSILTVGKL